MATKTGRETFVIETELLSNATQFSFIQAVRLLHRVTATDGPFDRIRVRPDLAWNTPLQEIACIEKRNSQHPVFLITATFLELYGATSPLPMFYTQDLFRDQTYHNSVSRDFIDIFNCILYEIYFDIRRKYHFSSRLFETPDPMFWEQLFCISGIGNSGVRKHLSTPQNQITYSGITSRPIRTAEGLRSILADTLKDIPVSIEQCIIRRARIPDCQRVSIGIVSSTLGDDIIIGKQITDRMGFFRVHIGVVSARQFSRFHPDSSLMMLLDELIRLYIDQPLQWDYEISCKTEDMTTVQLGGSKNAYLGWNTWVYSGKLEAEQVTARVNVCRPI